MKDIGLRVTREMDSRGLTDRDLAHLTGLSHGTISNLRNAKGSPLFDNVRIVCDFLDIAPGDFN